MLHPSGPNVPGGCFRAPAGAPASSRTFTTAPARTAQLLVAGLLSAACAPTDDADSATTSDASSSASVPTTGAPTGGVGESSGETPDPTTGTSETSTSETSTSETSTSETSTSETSASEGSSSSGEPEPVFLESYPLAAQYPEGGIYEPGDHAFYVGSLGDGSVHRIDAATGEETVLFTEVAPGNWWTLGMDVDVQRRRLWVCAMDDRSPDPRAGRVWIFDLDQGVRIADHALADAAPDATCTDVVVTADGVGHVADREVGNIYRVDVESGATLFTSSPDLEASFVGQNALVVLPDESALLSLLYLPSGLARVDLGDGTVLPVEISGKFSDLSPLSGADGMTLVDGTLHVAFTSVVVAVKPTLADWSAATSVAVDVPSGLTDMVATPGGLYVLNGQAVVFALGGEPDPFQLIRYVDP